MAYGIRVRTPQQRLMEAGVSQNAYPSSQYSSAVNAALRGIGQSEANQVWRAGGGRGPMTSGMTAAGGQQPSQAVAPTVQQGQATFQGAQPNQPMLPQGPGNPAATSGMAPGQEFIGGSQTNPGGFGAPESGLSGAERAYQAALSGGLGLLEQGNNQARADLMQAGQGANNTLNAYYDPGRRSNDYQAALTGALGSDAQAQAMANFSGSPGQQYLLDESERAIRRNAAATGGLGGGNVQRALQQNAIGLAAQDFDNSFRRLGTVSDRGLAAGGQISGNAMTTGGRLADVTNQNAQTGANMIYGTGNQLGAGRNRAGEMIAGNLQQGSGNLANLMYGTGRDISNVIGSQGNFLANLQLQSGAGASDILQAYANALAGNTQQGAATFAGVPSLGGTQQTRGALSSVGDLLSGGGAFMQSLPNNRM